MDDELVATEVRKLALSLPSFVLHTIVKELRASGVQLNPAAVELRLAQNIPQPSQRQQALDCIRSIHHAAPEITPRELAQAILTAENCVRFMKDELQTELVLTGPDVEGAPPFRKTEQALLQVLDSAKSRILLVSYAVYKIPRICQALVAAAHRGVKITILVETPNKIEGQNEFDTLRSLGEEVCSAAKVYFWPAENRAANENGKYGLLHIKCVVADGAHLLLTSANLTTQAFTINMELGVLLKARKQAAEIERYFDLLIEDGAIEPV